MRSGKVIETAPKKNEKNIEVTSEPSPSEFVSPEISPPSAVAVETEKIKEKEYVPPVPFPHRVLKNKRIEEGEKEREILDVF